MTDHSFFIHLCPSIYSSTHYPSIRCFYPSRPFPPIYSSIYVIIPLFSSTPCFIHTSIPLSSIHSYLHPSFLCIHPNIIPIFLSIHTSIFHSFVHHPSFVIHLSIHPSIHLFFFHPPTIKLFSLLEFFLIYSSAVLSFIICTFIHPSSFLSSLPLHNGLQFLRAPCLKPDCCTFKNPTEEDCKHVRILMQSHRVWNAAVLLIPALTQ